MGSFMTEAGCRRRARRIRALLAVAALATLGCAGAAPKITGPLMLHPLPPTGEKYALAQGAVVYTDQGFTVSARPWDYRLLAEEFRKAGEPNPFGETDEAVGRFLFLRVRLENRSSQNLVFNPMRAWLLCEGQAPLAPLENSDLFVYADDKIAEAEARGRAFRRVAFDLAATVRPGQALERYLVFKAPEEAPKRFTLAIEDLWLGSTSTDLKFGFEPFPGK
jgi:hypothetical protein